MKQPNRTFGTFRTKPEAFSTLWPILSSTVFSETSMNTVDNLPTPLYTKDKPSFGTKLVF